MSGRLNGKAALVTGASRGIGKATALIFAREGAAVGVNYAKSSESAHQLVDDIRKSGGQAIALQADVARAADVQAMVEETLAQFGKIDVLVNNAGVIQKANIQTLTEASLDEMISVNFKGIIHCTRAVVPHMIQRHYGKIINISSVAGLGTAVSDNTPYAATKAAVNILTKRLALELGPHGINVNAICPGYVRTDMTLSTAPPEEVKANFATAAGKAMLARIGAPEDIAHSVLFLASDEASFVTAQVLAVDGGRVDFLSHSG